MQLKPNEFGTSIRARDTFLLWILISVFPTQIPRFNILFVWLFSFTKHYREFAINVVLLHLIGGDDESRLRLLCNIFWFKHDKHCMRSVCRIRFWMYDKPKEQRDSAVSELRGAWATVTQRCARQNSLNRIQSMEFEQMIAKKEESNR